MTTVLAIASDPALDTDLVEGVTTTHPDRVTVLLLAQVEAHTGAVVTGLVGDSEAVDGHAFDDVVRTPGVLAAA